jgi:hypothetical protein
MTRIYNAADLIGKFKTEPVNDSGIDRDIFEFSSPWNYWIDDLSDEVKNAETLQYHRDRASHLLICYKNALKTICNSENKSEVAFANKLIDSILFSYKIHAETARIMMEEGKYRFPYEMLES